jgi:hypothetical protein
MPFTRNTGRAAFVLSRNINPLSPPEISSKYYAGQYNHAISTHKHDFSDANLETKREMTPDESSASLKKGSFSRISNMLITSFLPLR